MKSIIEESMFVFFSLFAGGLFIISLFLPLDTSLASFGVDPAVEIEQRYEHSEGEVETIKMLYISLMISQVVVILLLVVFLIYLIFVSYLWITKKKEKKRHLKYLLYIFIILIITYLLAIGGFFYMQNLFSRE